MVGEVGTAEELCRIGPRFPLMSDDAIVLFGYEPNPPEFGVLGRRSMSRYLAETVRGSAREAAAEALGYLEERARRFVVHFDVDVIDFVDLPQIKAGLTFREVMECLGVFAASPNFGGMVITEFNPDHADEEGDIAQTFVREVADVLAGSTT